MNRSRTFAARAACCALLLVTACSDGPGDAEPDGGVDADAGVVDCTDRVLVMLVNNVVDGDGVFAPPPYSDDATAAPLATLRDAAVAWYADVSDGQFCMQWTTTAWMNVDVGPGNDVNRQPLAYCALLAAGWSVEEIQRHDRFLILYTSTPPPGVPGGLASAHGPVLEAGACFAGSPALDLATYGTAKVNLSSASDQALGTVLHELGHTLKLGQRPGLPAVLGLGHASFWSSTTHSKIEYGDHTDVMGKTTTLAPFSAGYRHNLGWIPDSDALSVDGTWSGMLSPADGPEGLRVLYVPIDQGDGRIERWVQVEWRSADALSGAYNNRAGLQLRYRHFSDGDWLRYTTLIDATPETPSQQSQDAALMWGRSMTFGGRAAGTFVTISAGPTPGHVRVHFGASTSTLQATATATQIATGTDHWTARLQASAVGVADPLVFWRTVGDQRPYAEVGTHAEGAAVDVEIDNAACSPSSGCRLFALLSDGEGGTATVPIDVLGHVNTPIAVTDVACWDLGAVQQLNPVAANPDGNPLLFEWTIGGATFIAAQPHVMVNATTTVTVRVSDDLGTSWSVPYVEAIAPDACGERDPR